MTRITKRPLPELDSPEIQELGWNERSKQYHAYASVLQAEKRATMSGTGDLISVRVTGFLLLEFTVRSRILGTKPCDELVKWLTLSPQSSQSNQYDAIIKTGVLLRDKFIRAFRTTHTLYSQPLSHSLRPSFDTLEDMIKDSMEAAGRDYRTSRSKTLACDGYRCVITGIFNWTSLTHCPELRDLSNVRAFPLETAHIFNESTMQGIDPAIKEDDEGEFLNEIRTATGAPDILALFGFSKFTDTFKRAGGVHEVWNLLTLEYNLHTFFDNLSLWFELTEKLHCYKVCTLYRAQEKSIHSNFVGHDHHIDDAPMFVEFNAQFENVPPPDPLLLALHATCAHVAHMSSAAEFFDQIE